MTTITSCPICGGKIQATLSACVNLATLDLATGVGSGATLALSLDDHVVEGAPGESIYCEDDHSFTEMRDALRQGETHAYPHA